MKRDEFNRAWNPARRALRAFMKELGLSGGRQKRNLRKALRWEAKHGKV